MPGIRVVTDSACDLTDELAVGMAEARGLITVDSPPGDRLGQLPR